MCLFSQDRNVVAYIDGAALHNGYGGTVGDPGNGILDGHIQQLTNNKIVLGGAKYSLPICSGRGKTFQVRMHRLIRVRRCWCVNSK